MQGSNIREEKNHRKKEGRKTGKKTSPKFEVYREGTGSEYLLIRIRKIGEIVLGLEDCRRKGTLVTVLVDNERIQELNARFLGRNRPTDVIAFPLEADRDDIWGEIYVSEDQAKEQASEYGVSFEEELVRIVIHGILHLLGYDDGDRQSRGKMMEREDHYLKRFFREHGGDRE